MNNSRASVRKAGAHIAFLAPMFIAACGSAPCEAQDWPVQEPRRIVFLGDSITYNGLYIDYLEAYRYTRYPFFSLEVINLGLPSENLSGLTEPGHAGGAFPRPNLHDRLERALDLTEPDMLLACYGMNDGIYYPLDDERLEAFKDGVTRLVNAAQMRDIPLVLLTPSPFDPVPLAGKTLPDGLDEYPAGQPYQRYDEVLETFSQWLIDQRAKGWRVVDLHGPMNAYLAQRREQEPDYVLTRDGVHATALGHWLMAREVLKTMAAPGNADQAHIDAATRTAERGNVSELVVDEKGISFAWATEHPMPVDPAWDLGPDDAAQISSDIFSHRLVITGVAEGDYELREGDTVVATVSSQELAAGLDLLRYPKLSTNASGPELLKLIRQRQSLLTDAWLTAVGHDRPGMREGLPLEEANAEAARIEASIKQLAGPVTLRLRLVPANKQREDAALQFPGKVSDYRGFERHDFVVDGCDVLVVKPKQPAPGKPWIWRAEFFDHEPQADVALLGKGFHLVYMQVGNTFGCPDAMKHWNVLYAELTGKYGLSAKPALEGLSRGGLYCYNWGAANPDKVGCIYGDAPVCDFKSWPAGKGKGNGSPGDWAKLIKDYHFASEAEALAYDKNPVDNLEPLAKAGVPLLHVYGDVDESVPHEENTLVVKERYEALGGSITLIVKPGVGHHPHSLVDPTPIVEFILKHTAGAE